MKKNSLAKRVVIILLVIVMLGHFIQASSESFDRNQGNRRELRTRSKAPPAPNLRPNVQYNPPVILGSPPPPPPTRSRRELRMQKLAPPSPKAGPSLGFFPPKNPPPIFSPPPSPPTHILGRSLHL
nr:hypothetical protein [Tanacetum cinerariifolium]